MDKRKISGNSKYKGTFIIDQTIPQKSETKNFKCLPRTRVSSISDTVNSAKGPGYAI